jgi:hypothetical protein
VRQRQFVAQPVHLFVSQTKHRRMPASDAVQKHETMTAQGETSVRRVGKISPEEFEISRRHIVVAGDSVDRKPASPDNFFDKLVFILLAVVGVIARQQREIDTRLHLPVRVIDQGEEVAMALFVGPGNMKIAEINPGNSSAHAEPQCFAINAMPPTISNAPAIRQMLSAWTGM